MSRIIIDVVTNHEVLYYGDVSITVEDESSAALQWTPKSSRKLGLMETLIQELKARLKEEPEKDKHDILEETIAELEFVQGIEMQY
jgi:hypothetical protein